MAKTTEFFNVYNNTFFTVFYIVSLTLKYY